MIEECLVVEIRIEGDACPLADATDVATTTVEAATPVFRRDGNVLLHFTVPRVDEERLTAALETDDRIRYLHRATGGDVATYRCLSHEPCVLHDLADVGLLVESVQYRHGEAHLAGSVVGTAVLEGVLEAAGDTVGVHIERITPLGREGATSPGRRWDLTTAQEEALTAALAAGYFEVPKAATAAEVADAIGISKSAFLERLRRGQRSLLSQTLHTHS